MKNNWLPFSIIFFSLGLALTAWGFGIYNAGKMLRSKSTKERVEILEVQMNVVINEIREINNKNKK